MGASMGVARQMEEGGRRAASAFTIGDDQTRGPNSEWHAQFRPAASSLATRDQTVANSRRAAAGCGWLCWIRELVIGLRLLVCGGANQRMCECLLTFVTSPDLHPLKA